MAKYEIISVSDTRLNGISAVVDDPTSQRVRDVLEVMKSIALGARDEHQPEKPSMVGLAAPQIGVFERIIVIDTNARPDASNFDVDLQFIINPQIKNVSFEEELGREGCYSTGDIAGAVYRAKTVTLTGLDENGESVEYKLDGFLARIAQHEVDHLNGIRFPDRIRDPKHLHAFNFKSKEFQQYREEWAIWPKLYPIEDWLKVKNGGPQV